MLLLLVSFLTQELPAAILHADSIAAIGGNGHSWAAAFPKIQDAINSASTNDEVWVAAGTYYENLVLRDGISLFGGFSGTETNRSQRNWNIHSTILDGENVARAVSVPSVSSPTRLDGFVIQNGRADFGAGIYSAGGEFISANNLIIHNSAAGVFGGSGAFVDESARFLEQTPITFFTNLANRILQLHSPGLDINHIQIYPTNQYTPEAHRSLQLAANIYDATTNRSASYPYFPSVFRPVFANESGNIFISGFVEATNDAFVTNLWLALASEQDRNLLAIPSISSNANIFGQPIIIGVKKGFPNFNEFSMETVAQVARLLEVRKASTNFPPVFLQTNQMYRLSITNIFGVESWNSYAQTFPRPLQLYVSHMFAAFITDETGAVIWPTNGISFSTNFVSIVVNSNWPGVNPLQENSNSFVLPYFATNATLPLSLYLSSTPHFQPVSTNFETNAGFPIPQWTLNLSNRIQYVAIDSGRVVDFVNLNGPSAQIDLTRKLLGSGFAIPPFGCGEPSSIANMWRTNRTGGSTNTDVSTLGIQSQFYVSFGMPMLTDSDWQSFNGIPIVNKEKAIAEFTKFMGFTPTIPGYQNIPMPTNLIFTAPFAPTRKLFHRISLQANDPLVHFQMSDLLHGPDVLQPIIPPLGFPLLPSNLKRLNDVCRPYPQPGINRYFFYDANTNNPAFEDTDIGWSSDWNFPTGHCFNLAWLDKIHRGTPWQTIYTGVASDSANWEDWAGSSETNPTNDWKIIEMFLAERKALGTALSIGSPIFVNNTFAANTGHGGAATFASRATFLNNIVAGNASGLLRLLVTNEVQLQTNCVFNNAQFDYANLSNPLENLTVNPQFNPTANGNFHLLATSPCVDGGSESVFSSGWLMNEPARRDGAGVDVGAFELSGNDAPVFVSPSVSNGPHQFSFQVTGLSGESYVTEMSTDLLQWFPIATNITVNGFFSVSNPLGSASNQFFRAVHLP